MRTPQQANYCIKNYFLFVFFLLPIQVVAQTAPQLPESVPLPILPPPQPQPEVEPLPTLEEVLPTPEPSPATPQPSLEVPDTITVRQFEVIGSTVFSQAELAAVLKPYIQRPITFSELLEAQSAVTELYVDNGYITSGAFIAPQTLENGVVTIEVVEGEVEEIEITGLKRLNSGYVRSRLAQATEAPLNRDKLLEALQLLQLDPLIKSLSAELAAGVRPGVSILEVAVQEADPFAVELSIDNRRAPSVGTVRRQVDITQGNLFGWGDRFHVGYINTEGSDSLDDLRYTLPLNASNGTVSFSHYRTDSEIIEEPFNVLDIQSEIRRYEFTYRQPLSQKPTEEFALGLSFSRDSLKIDYFDPLQGDRTPFPARGADEEGKTTISALRFTQEYTNRNEQQVFALFSQMSLGVDVFGATTTDDAPDSQFFAWRGLAQYLRLLAPETVLLLRTDLQLASVALVPIEQFSLGGQLNVRGYRQDALIADNGFLASAEVRTPILRIPQWETTLELAPFVDFGTVWNNDDLELEESVLSSVGLGLRLLVGNFAARFDWGIPLVNLNIDEDTLQEQGVYFSVEYRPF